MFDIKEKTKELLAGCQIPSDVGVSFYTPDGKGDYHALWTRDFYYMIENAMDLMDNRNVEGCIRLLLDTANFDGWIADRIQPNGRAIYTAGDSNFPALPNLDNGCFLCLCADVYLRSIDSSVAKERFSEWKEQLCRAVDCLPQDENGFMINISTPLHSPYGFTDTVRKTGRLCFETLLLWQAQKALCYWLTKCDCPREKYEKRLRSIEKHFMDVFLHESGMLIAFTCEGTKVDLWASCFAISIGFPMAQTKRERICAWMIEHHSRVISHGQLRHLPAEEYWESTFIPVEQGTYQNGAFWATPCKWLYDTLAVLDKELAKHTFEELLAYFDTYGIFECINGEYRKLDTYVASITPAYALYQRIYA